MKPLYLVDGSGYIFRAYYAVQPLSTSKGLPTNALFGFTRMLIKLLREVEAQYIAITFDTAKPTFRHEMYDEYKANRAECPEDLAPQMPYFRKIVEAFGIQSLEKEGFEADDIIATLTKGLKSSDRKVVIVSGDKDLCQLVESNVEVWDAMRDIVYDVGGVQKKFGVRPEQMVDYLALTGDSSDNIPGVRGVGPKSAQRLIEEFGSISQLIENAERIQELKGLRGSKSLREKIELAGEELRLSQKLVELDSNVQPFNLVADVEEFHWQEARAELIVPLFEELEFNKMLSQVPLDPSALPSDEDSSLKDKKSFSRVTPKNFPDFIEKFSAIKRFAFDTETTSLDVLSCELVGISISWEKDNAYYLPFAGMGELLDRELVFEAIKPIFANPEIEKVGHHLKFDVGVLEESGIEVRGLSFDSMLATYILHPDNRQRGLKPLVKRYLDEEMVTFEEMLEGVESILEVEAERLTHYASHDAEATFSLSEVLLGELDETPSLKEVLDKVEMPLISVLSRMERVGIKIDLPFLEKLGAEFSSELAKLESSIQALAGEEFNLNSPKQLSTILFEKLELPTKGVRKTKTGFSTDAGVLAKLSDEHEIVEKILDYRELHKLNSTYVEALQRLVHPKTGRIHSSFNQAIAATGRLSSSDPNLQNIPIRNPRGRQIREAFIAEDGKVLIAADYSQIELRVLAHLCGDEGLRGAFHSGEDIHKRTAKEIFGTAAMDEEELKDLRRVAKTINFGILYGMSAFRLAGDLGVSRKQAQNYIDEYFARYPKVLEYFDMLRESLSEKGYVETLFGRRRFLQELDTSGRDAGFAERSLLNAPLQGSAAEIIKVAMIRLDEVLKTYDTRARMVLQVHDELVFEVDESLSGEIQDLVVREMESAVDLAVPLKVDVRLAKTWGES